MINPKDHFIILLSLGFIITALFVKLPVFNIRPIRATDELKISQQEALQLVDERPEVKEFLKKAASRKENEAGILISQGKIILEQTATKVSPFWEFQVFEEVIEIPKEGEPRTLTIPFNWYRVDAQSGEVTKSF